MEFLNKEELTIEWKLLGEKVSKMFDSEVPDIKVLLFLIGVQELGQGPRKFSKRQKEELMHIATCRLMSEMDYYELEGIDQDGWPHWKDKNPLPPFTLREQENLLKQLIIYYFNTNN